jgi:release factor glutamine methyltransferase
LTLADVLAEARRRIPPAEARLLLGHLLTRPTAWLEAHREEMLSTEQLTQFRGLVTRRAAGEPVAYLLGSREFYGRDFTVTPAVLIPRPETELLVEVALGKVGAGGTAKILDLGAGSGCIATTLALELPAAQVTAVDVSPAALVVARENALRLAAAVDFIESDWLAALPVARFDLIVANPPYVAAGDRHLAEGDLRFEPQEALTDRADGLSALRYIVAEAPRWLTGGGWLFLEHGYDQGAAVYDLLRVAGFADIEQHCDLAGIIRVSGGRLGNDRANESACI